jgi:MYXO-CTERM domain-containing protein
MEEGNESIHTTNDTLALSKNSVAHTMHFVRFGLAFMAELAKGELSAPEPVCSATKPCPSGERCENEACVPDVSADAPDAATPNGFADPPASPACSATKACASGSTCVGGTCVVPTGSTGARDAGRAQRDATVTDVGSKKPTVSTDGDPSTAADDDGESAADQDDARSPAAARESGCSVSSAGGVPGGASLLWLVAGALVVGRRRKRALEH